MRSKIGKNLGKLVLGILLLGAGLSGLGTAKFWSAEFLVLDRDLGGVTLANLDSHLDGVRLPLPEQRTGSSQGSSSG